MDWVCRSSLMRSIGAARVFAMIPDMPPARRLEENRVQVLSVDAEDADDAVILSIDTVIDL